MAALTAPLHASLAIFFLSAALVGPCFFSLPSASAPLCFYFFLGAPSAAARQTNYSSVSCGIEFAILKTSHFTKGSGVILKGVTLHCLRRSPHASRPFSVLTLFFS